MGSALGCSADDNVPRVHSWNGNNRTSFGSVRCNCSRANDVTHFNSTSNELLCTSCYSSMKRNKKLSMRNVHDISGYMRTLAFRQHVTTLNKNARSMEDRCLTILTHYHQTNQVLEAKRNGLLSEVRTFIQDLVDLLNHMKDELCTEVNTEINKTLDKTSDQSRSVQTALDNLRKHKASFQKGQNNNNSRSTQNLNSMLELEAYLNEVNTATKTYHDFVPKLRINKALKLEDVFGNRSGSKRLKLGRFNIDTATLDSSAVLVETLDDVTDESSVPPSPDSTQERTQSSLNYRGKSRIESSSRRDLSIRLPKTPTPVPKVSDNKNLPVNHSADDGRQTGIFSPPHVSSKRVSFSECDSRYTGVTPRRSTMSILSPGKLDTPVFMTPTPRPTFNAHLENSKISMVKTVTLPSDTHCPNVTSSAISDNGLVILCDQQNLSLSIYDTDFRRTDVQKFQTCPHNVTYVKGYGVAASFPSEKCIRFLKIERRVFCDVKVSETKAACFGIAVADGNIVYTTGKSNDVAVFVKDDERKRTLKFQYAFHQPLSLQFDEHCNHLFVTCYGMKDAPGRVVKMNFYKQNVDFETNCPEILKPVSTVLDGSGYIYVCDVKPHAVHQLTPAGDYVRKILGENDGHFQHINFLANSKQFFAAENNSNKIKIYAFE